ncbi:choice-of-anchor P family protein [Actinomadura macra]|uniref:choice-of-anchor P family protein n=1 Tax=Actinomadura macra TaxID=46164 RepID=UPI00083128E4|nr:choice-of-anchor P family protein [Actinomadura macra]
MQALTKCAIAVGALALPFTAATPAAVATPAPGAASAAAISASGPVAIPATPSVAGASQLPVRRSVAELPANPLAEARSLSAAAWAGHGRASVADLKIAKLLLSASAVTAKCENGHGVSRLAKAVLNGRRLAVTADPNTTVTARLNQVGVVSVTLNKQVRERNGDLSVTAIEIGLPLGPGGTQTLKIASVTCGKGGGPRPTPPTTPGHPGSPAPSPSAPPAAAPAPTPVPGDLPVTG